MKRLLFVLTVLLAANAGFAQGKANWKEMHDFHGVMSKTFHPAEENNLGPVRDSATMLVMRATAWQRSAVPEGYNAEVTKPILKDLVKQCETIQKAVRSRKSDADLKILITKAHDIFHEIMEKCRDEKH